LHPIIFEQAVCAMKITEHWERIYATKRPHQVSWYRRHLDVSLRLITNASEDAATRIVDVGGGESTLVDDLIAAGYRDVTVLDLSATALDVAKRRLGGDAAHATWIQADVCTHPFRSRVFDIWHDRAVFHFLTDLRDRAAYVRQVGRAVRDGGHVIVATFGPDGPLQCSGLDVVRYDAQSLHDAFGMRFALVDHLTEVHETPWGTIQQFVYCYCKLLRD
jgi:SAM-dependent methyltransferase